MSLISPQPRLRLYTKPISYYWACKHLVRPYGKEYVFDAETELAAYTGSQHAIMTSMGRTAIYLGLKALLDPGDEVIVSPLTVPEVISMMDLIGVIPVFCDTEPGTWNLDPSRVDDLITNKTRAVMTTHLYGLANTIEPVREICAQHGLAFLEDAAQGLSTRYQGRMAGTLGKFGIYSFSYPKNVCAFYGGALVTDDYALATEVRQLVGGWPAQNKAWYYRRVCSSLIKDALTADVVYPLGVARVIRFAYAQDISALKRQVELHLPVRRFPSMPPPYGTKPSGLQGKLVTAKLPDVDREARHRINAAMIYDQGLRDIKQIIRPPYRSDFGHTYLYYPIQVPDRISLMRFMIARGRDVAYQHIPNCAREPVFANYARSCPNADLAAQRTLTLPTYAKYRLDEVERTVGVIREFFGKRPHHVG